MARPRKWRNVCDLPERDRFGPLGSPVDFEDKIIMAVDEYEAIRLIDWEGLSQEECAARMNVARTTVQGIYAEARKKLAASLVDGKVLLIEGGEYRLCSERGARCGPGCRMAGPRRQGPGQGPGGQSVSYEAGPRRQGLGQGPGGQIASHEAGPRRQGLGQGPGIPRRDGSGQGLGQRQGLGPGQGQDPGDGYDPDKPRRNGSGPDPKEKYKEKNDENSDTRGRE